MPEVLRATEELEAFQPAWEKLWREDPNATPFQHPAWLLSWWRQFAGRDLCAVIVRRSGKPVAFLPFYVYEKPASNQRQLLMLGVGTSDYLDGLFAPECAPEDVMAAINLLREESGWEAMMISQVRPQSKLFRALKLSGIEPMPGERCWRMPAVPVAELPSAIRRNVMYYRNRAARAGTLELRMADASTWPEVFDALVRLHTAEWQSRGEPGALADPRVLAWHREAIPLLQAEGLLRLCSLHLNGEVVAAAYSLADPAGRSHRAQYVYLPAYAWQHADLRPGTLLLALVMESAAEEGVDFLDLLRGDEAYKQLWHAEALETHGFLIRAREETRQIAA